MSRPEKLGVIGAGAMAEALVGGWLDAGLFEPGNVLASDPVAARRKVFRSKLKTLVTEDNAAVARHAEMLLVAVKPQVLERVCTPLAEHVQEGTLIVSIAAGVTLETLAAAFGEDGPIVRTMPNILHSLQAGAAGLCCNDHVSPAQQEFVLECFRSVGVAEVVDEWQMDAVTGLSGSGPAFVFVFLEALSDAGVAAGLPRKMATEFAAQTALGAAKWVLQGKRPGELKEQVTSPGGTTIEGLRVAEERGLRSAAIEAVLAAAAKSEELGRRPDKG